MTLPFLSLGLLILLLSIYTLLIADQDLSHSLWTLQTFLHSSEHLDSLTDNMDVDT